MADFVQQLLEDDRLDDVILRTQPQRLDELAAGGAAALDAAADDRARA